MPLVQNPVNPWAEPEQTWDPDQGWLPSQPTLPISPWDAPTGGVGAAILPRVDSTGRVPVWLMKLLQELQANRTGQRLRRIPGPPVTVRGEMPPHDPGIFGT